MEKDFNQALDECINRVNHGETLKTCLADYPQYAAELEPLLQAMTQTRTALDFTPSEDAKRSGRQRLYDALEKKHKPSFWQQVFGRKAVWLTLASVIVIGITAYLGLKAIIAPVGPTGGNIANPSPGSVAGPISSSDSTSVAPSEPGSDLIAMANVNGNFAFLVSDEVNAISEFSAVNVTIDRIGILQNGESGRWQEFVPEIKDFDLSLLPGAITQELWRGNVPEGQYNKVFIYVSKINGILKTTGETVSIKLPSNKIQISLPFQVNSGNMTSFTFDMTVLNTGNSKKGERYLLKPQIGESGATQKPLPKYESENDKKANLPPDTLSPFPVTNNRKK